MYNDTDKKNREEKQEGNRHEEGAAVVEDHYYYETFQPFFFFPYSVTVTKGKVSFGYSFSWFTQTINLSTTTIVHATPLENVKGLREWGGWGIRLRRTEGHWETGYIAKNGGAVKVEVSTKSHDPHHGQNDSSMSSSSSRRSWYVFTCSDPQRVCDLLYNSEEGNFKKARTSLP